MERKGLIHVYTGDGKGKTTAAIGLAIRAIGHNLKVGYIGFYKGSSWGESGEFSILKKLGVDVFLFACKHPHFFKNINIEEVRKECLKGLEFIKKVYLKEKYDLLILDEVIISLRDGFLKEEEVFELLNLKPEKLELVLTGRGFLESLIEKVDYVSNVKKIKHPYDRGIKKRKGIEY